MRAWLVAVFVVVASVGGVAAYLTVRALATEEIVISESDADIDGDEEDDDAQEPAAAVQPVPHGPCPLVFDEPTRATPMELLPEMVRCADKLRPGSKLISAGAGRPISAAGQDAPSPGGSHRLFDTRR